MPLKWHFSGRPLHACLVALWFFGCSGPLLLRNLIGLWISRGGGGSGTMPPLDPHMPLLYTGYYFNFITQCSNSLTRDCSNRKNMWKGEISFVKKYRWEQYASWFQDFYSCFWWLKNGDWDFSQVLLFYIVKYMIQSILWRRGWRFGILWVDFMHISRLKFCSKSANICCINPHEGVRSQGLPQRTLAMWSVLVDCLIAPPLGLH